MPKQEVPAAMLQSGGPRYPSQGKSWVTWLLAAAAAVYGVEAVLLLSMPVPTWMVWGLLAVVTGLVALACLIGTGSAVWAKAEPGLAQRREQRRSRDAWVQFWEDLAQRSVR